MSRGNGSNSVLKILLFIAIAVALFFGLKSLFPSVTSTKTATTTPATQTQTKPAETVKPVAKLSTKTETGSTDHYTTTITRPVVLGLSDTLNAKINADITAKINEIKKSFIEDQSDINFEVGPGEKSTLEISFKPEDKREAHGILAIPFSVNTYSNGAAHPNEYTQVLNYNVATGERITIPDIFKDKGTAYKTVSIEAIKKLEALFKKERNTDWFREGADPIPENYENFILTDGAMTIIFNAYQVAPYVRGAVTIQIPLSAFSDKLSIQ